MTINGMISFLHAGLFDATVYPNQVSLKSNRKELSSRLDAWLGEVHAEMPLPKKIHLD
jgi:hypothetical protein